jgi:plastocyanin
MRLGRTLSLPILGAALIALTLVASCGGGGGGGGGGITNPPPGKELASPVMGAGATFTHRFFNAGTFPYHCEIHPSMNGVSVVVSAAAPAADTSKTVSIIGMTSPFYSPATVTIRPGGKVVWTNNDAVSHTVTSD